MLYVYNFIGSDLMILDKENRTMSFIPAISIARGHRPSKIKEVTKAIINRNIKHYGYYVGGNAILDVFAPQEIREHDRRNGYIREYIGKFETYDDIQTFLNGLINKVRAYYGGNVSGIELAEILEYHSKWQRGLSDWEIEKQAEALADESNAWHRHWKRYKDMFDILSA